MDNNTVPSLLHLFILNRMFNESGLQLSLNACVETIRLFKKELNKTFAEAPVRNRLCELIKLLAEVLSSAIAQTKFEYLYGQYESLNLILIFMDNFLLLSKQNGYLDSLFNSVINQINNEYFNENVDFRTAETVERFQNLVVAMSVGFNKDLNGEASELVERLDETLNIFYVNVIEFLVFDKSGEHQRVPMENTVELVLKAITNSCLQLPTGQCFRIKSTYRSLLVRIVYRSLSDKVSAPYGFTFCF